MVFFEALTHLNPLLSFLSTLYPLMSLPPSTIGLFQEIVTAFLLTLSISGFEGGPGGPAKKREEVKEKKIVLSIYLYIYIYIYLCGCFRVKNAIFYSML